MTKHFRVLVCFNMYEARDEYDAEARVMRLIELSPAMGKPDADWYVDRVEEADDDDIEAHLRAMEEAADEHAVGLPFGGSR